MWRRGRTATTDTGAGVGAGAIVAEIAAQGASAPIAVGANILQNVVEAGGVVNVLPSQQAPTVQARPVPVRLTPRDLPDLLGRERELADALAAVGDGAAVAVVAASGAGKTALLRRISHLGAGALTDGVVFLRAAGQPREDVERFLFDAFYTADRPYQPTPGELRRLLADRRALVVLDDVELGRDDVCELLDCAPGCCFVLASERRCLWGEGHELDLSGLAPDDAVALFERWLGRPLGDGERPRVEDLCRRLGGRPMAILRAAALARDGELPLATAGQLEADVRAGLDDAETRVLRALELLAPASVHVDDVAAIAGVPNAAEVLERLRARHAAEAHSPRWTATLAPEDDADLELLRRAGARLAEGAERRPAEDVPAILAVLRRGEQAAHAGEVLALARAADPLLASSGRWGAWAQALQRARRAATATGDRAGAAWALHQLGTRAGCLGDPGGAECLREALALRRALGDERGAAVTEHNLALLFGGGGGGGHGSGDDQGPGGSSPGRWLAVGAGVVALGVAAALLLGANDSSTGSPAGVVGTTTTVTTTTVTTTTTTTTTTDGGGAPNGRGSEARSSSGNERRSAGGGVQLEISGEQEFAADPDGIVQHTFDVRDLGPSPLRIQPSLDNTAFRIGGVYCPDPLAVGADCRVIVEYTVGDQQSSATLRFAGSPSTASLTGAGRRPTTTSTATQPPPVTSTEPVVR